MAIEIKRILMPTDFSGHSAAALDQRRGRRGQGAQPCQGAEGNTKEIRPERLKRFTQNEATTYNQENDGLTTGGA